MAVMVISRTALYFSGKFNSRIIKILLFFVDVVAVFKLLL